ncbi:sortase domain-containing protein [Nocardioides sp.]|uniref:sortase domain-containing protein n=1 Tax=Nocardioides sp. TaxID=35761 RepID=UPI003D1085BF
MLEHHPRATARPTRLLAILTSLLMSVLATLSITAPARADVIDDAITGVTLQTTGDVWDGETLRFSCTWRVPVGSQPGDTFTLQLPDELRWQGAASFPLLAPDGVTPVAQGVVSAGGLVTFTLTDYMLAHPSASGTCSFTTIYQATGPGEHELTFDTGTSVITVPVTEGVQCEEDCGVNRATKRGWWLDPANPTRMQFVILAPATADTDDNTIEFIDRPSAGYTLDCSSLSSAISATTNASGAVTAPYAGHYDATRTPAYPAGQQLGAPTVTCTTTSLSVIWSHVPQGFYSEVRIKADVTDPSLKEYTNTGVVRMNGVEQSDGFTLINPTPTGDGQGPDIHLEKWSTNDGGPATTDGTDFPGDYDDAPGADLVVGQPTPITFTITNTGDEPLRQVEVSDATIAGPAITDISCDFSALGGPSSGTTWVEGPFNPGDSFTCTGTVPAMAAGTSHSDDATVTGIGIATGAPVTSHDTWHGHTPPAPAKARPSLTTRTSAAVAAPGVTLRDRVTGSGYGTYTGIGRATLYGPFSSPKAARCTSATAVGTVEFTPRNGTVTTPGITIAEPGHYTWVARSSADAHHVAATHRCGLASESTLVRKPPMLIPPLVNTGFSGTLGRLLARPSVARPSVARVTFPGARLNARVSPTGLVGRRMSLPRTTQRLVMLDRTATPGDAIGTTVIAGHVSNEHNVPGAMWGLRKAKAGQLIGYRAGDGTVHRYRVTHRRLYTRGHLPLRVFSTTGAPRLALITCARIKVRPDGHFHYTKNLVVFAKPV